VQAEPTFQADGLEAFNTNASGDTPSNQLTTDSSMRLPGDAPGVEPGQVNSSPCLQITPELLADFRRWLLEEEGTSEGTVRKYWYYLPKLEGFSLCDKASVSKAFSLMGLNKVSYEAFSRLLTFLEKKTSYEELALSLRRALPKKPKAKEDTYVPSDNQVRANLDCVSQYGEAYILLHYILAYSGLRFEEALEILRSRILRAVELGYGAVRVHLDMQRGSKRAYVAYLPSWLWEHIQAYEGPLHNEHTIKRRFRGCGLAVKYYRKWWRQKAKELGVDSETIEAFQGRPRTIGGRHYTDWLPILDREYQRIMEYITEKLGLGGGG